MSFSRYWICLGIAVGISSGTASAQDLSTEDLTALSITELLNVEVTSVSRSAKKLSTAPAAITVVSGDDIRRIGATTIPEALRLVPGMQVGQVDSHTWAVSARGFNDVFANKLLVMIDGRTIYTPLFSGVFWDVQDTLLQDIDRIEVIRGPGASLWGANAVNGVVNIITKSAKETQGLLISAGTGTEELAIGDIRYGAKINDEAFARVYAKYVNRDHTARPNGDPANDRWDMYRAGFRVDWEPTEPNLFTFQGDIYSGTLDQEYFVPTFSPPFVGLLDSDLEVNGGNLLGRWTHQFSAESEMSWQLYFDHTTRNAEVLEEERNTVDLDFQHFFPLGDRHEITWGAGYRRTEDNLGNTVILSLFPDHRGLDLFSAFVQDEIALVDETLALTIGSKFEHNDFTGFEVQPSARLAWNISTNSVLWSAVSRAVRTPSRAESDIIINPPGFLPGTQSTFGNKNMRSEELLAYEIGYRCQPLSKITLDVAAFYHDYDDIRSARPVGPDPLGPEVLVNGLEGETYGFELTSTYQILEQWRLQAGYTYTETQMHFKEAVSGATGEQGAERSNPEHQFFARVMIDFGRKRDFGHEFQFDTLLRFVDSIRVAGDAIPSYWSADVRLGWRPHRNWEISIVGKNLLDNQHPEFYQTSVPTQRAEIERSVYAKVTFQF